VRRAPQSAHSGGRHTDLCGRPVGASRQFNQTPGCIELNSIYLDNYLVYVIFFINSFSSPGGTRLNHRDQQTVTDT